MKISKRLLSLISFIEKDDRVLDLGCDHAYLSIYLAKNELCQQVLASDISAQILKEAQKNIAQYNLEKKITLYQSDGLLKIKKIYNTIVIAGLGTENIKRIIPGFVNVKKIIIQSNNDLPSLRKHFTKIGFSIAKEIWVNEKNKDYISIMFLPQKISLKYGEYKIGKYNPDNKTYYQNLLNKKRTLLNNIPFKYLGKKIEICLDIFLLKYYLRKTG